MDILHKQERIIICLTVVQHCWGYSSCSCTITYACHIYRKMNWSGHLQLPGLELGWCQEATGYRICFSIKMNFFTKVFLWNQLPWREGVHHHWASSVYSSQQMTDRSQTGQSQSGPFQPKRISCHNLKCNLAGAQSLCCFPWPNGQAWSWLTIMFPLATCPGPCCSHCTTKSWICAQHCQEGSASVHRMCSSSDGKEITQMGKAPLTHHHAEW